MAALLTDSRLVTLTGPGGMGKTRLSVQVAAELIPQFPDGVWLVELAPLTDPGLVPEAVAAVIPGSRSHPGRRSGRHVASAIGEQRVLLVLDNCEHLVEPCAQLVDFLLRSCAELSVLATSREPLGVGGEHRWSVGPLSLPDSTQADAASVQASDAGELFLRRATETSRDFRLTDAVAPTVAEICERLDGMPLAIELAAARLSSLAPADVLEGLDDRFQLLTTGSRTAMPRHQTLAATLEWSDDLLSSAEATLLRRVSVFAGWGLPAAQEVCSGGDVERGEVVDLLAALANKSLVVVETPGDQVRYSLLETIRAWARTQLEDASDADVLARHASWCVALAERAEHELGGGRPQVWLDRLEVEEDNLRAGLEWARATGDVELGARLAAALVTFWRTRGHLAEGLGWLEWAVTASEDCPAALRARVLRGAGLLHGMLGDITAALPLLEESSSLFDESGDHDASLCACTSMFHMFRNPRKALPGLEEEVESCRRTGDTNKLAHFLWALGQGHFLLGELTQARRHFEEGVELARGEADGEALRSGLFGLGRVAILLGEPGEAEAALTEARADAEKRADDDDLATALGLLGDLARARGDYDRARELLDESMRLTSAEGSPVGMARAVYFSARLVEAQSVDDDDGAGELFGHALSLARGAEGLGFHDARCLLGLGWAAHANGERSVAAGHYLEALATAQEIGDTQASADALNRLSMLARLDGRPEEADTLARRGLELHDSVGDLAGIASSLSCLATLAADGERWQYAARMLAAAQALLDTVGYAHSGWDQAHWASDLEQVRSEMGEKELAAAMEQGASLSMDDAVAYATRGRGSRERPSSGWESLTPAQREVAQMAGKGLTNAEVGRRLFISPRTVGHHLANVYQKLEIHSRGALIKSLADREADSE